VPGTGQSKCYDNETEIACPLPGEPFYGQDTQHACNPHSYTDFENGIILDNVTGLMWQQATEPGTYNWDQALTYCENLTLPEGGYSDWRLPTIKELTTLMDSSIPPPGPTLNTNYFPDTVASYYWSSTTLENDTARAWYADFHFGFLNNGSKPEGYIYVRAVRGGPSNNNFIDNGDGTTSDTTTGLMWQQATAPDTYTWKQALAYCENIVLGNYNDWRLPNINELQSILDYNRSTPSIDSIAFPGTVTSRYWSSTTYVSQPYRAWRVNFGYGHKYYYDKPDYLYVRAVRGGPCGSIVDSDGDGIENDGDNSSIVGDTPCTAGETVNCDDNCIRIFNPDQADADSDSVGDICDNCPGDNNTSQSDTDSDGLGDVCDICPNDPDNDIDNDTICGDIDVCPTDPTNDTDNDTVCGLSDNCPLTPNGTGLGTCVKLIGGIFISTDATCSGHEDCELDEFCQTNQEDINVNTIGDACECYADCDNDTNVGLFDLAKMKTEFGSACPPCDADLNDDNGVGLFDLAIMKAQFGQSGCPVVP
jgi:Protein of unknown function (DUF1566)/Thrombospondin type 3 repeat